MTASKFYRTKVYWKFKSAAANVLAYYWLQVNSSEMKVYWCAIANELANYWLQVNSAKIKFISLVKVLQQKNCWTLFFWHHEEKKFVEKYFVFWLKDIACQVSSSLDVELITHFHFLTGWKKSWSRAELAYTDLSDKLIFSCNQEIKF